MIRKKRNKNSKINESWLLPYSDLLTLLAALFIVLFAMSEIDAQKYKEMSQVFKSEFSNKEGIPGESGSMIDNLDEETESEQREAESEVDSEVVEISELQALQEKVNNYITENKLSEVLDTKLTDEGLLVTILNDISFDSGSDRVNKKGKQIAEEISTLLYTDPPRQIVVSGHTDNQPIHNAEFSSNWELSAMRAINFMTLILAANDDLDPTKFSSKGFGEHRPVAKNNNKKNRAENRRVEVLILPNWDMGTLSPRPATALFSAPKVRGRSIGRELFLDSVLRLSRLCLF